ncbi:hypothetical protein, partial [Mesorhizobium sp.]|uniref:hypothetical protein n=1 Tax=Mesorhizobium sp. TaxID=1871066 RepID=UPI0025E099B8
LQALVFPQFRTETASRLSRNCSKQNTTAKGITPESSNLLKVFAAGPVRRLLIRSALQHFDTGQGLAFHP